jgi:hypothetical protein
MNATLATVSATAAACLFSTLALAQTFSPVLDANTPVQGFGFSVLPPSTAQWFYAVDSRSEAVAFGKKDPEHAKKRGSVIIIAERKRSRAGSIDTSTEFKAEVTSQVRASSARFNILSLDVAPYRDEAMNTDCVRITAVSEERANPNRPGEVLLMTIYGKACRQPDSPAHYVQVTVSERRPTESTTLFDDALRLECDRAVNSVQFIPAR